MFKLSERPFFIGLCVIGLFVAVLSLVWRNGGHRAEEQSWSMRQRASISTGPVREEAASVPVASESASPSIETQRADTGDNEIATDFQSATPQDRVEAPALQKRSHAKPMQKPRASHATVSPERSAPSKANDKPASRDAEVAVKQAEPRDPEPVQVTRPDVDTSHETLSPPAPVKPAQPPVEATTNTQMQVDASTSRPKTRKDVEDELRKARMNGALPRFGNPDPYGPGGAPSQSN
jgi:hypothetical protein